MTMDKNITELTPPRLQPREKSSIISKLFYCWSLPLFYKRYKKEVTEDEHYKPLKSHESKRLGDKLEEAWLKENSSNSNASLWKAIWKTFHLQFLTIGLIFVVSEFTIKMSQPWLIGKLMSQYSDSTTPNSKNDVYLYSSLILLNNFLSVMIGHNYQLYVQHLGMKIRVACCSLIYRKALKLSKTSLAELTVGKMVNLLTNDVNRFDTAAMHMIQLFVAPFETIFVIWCLYVTVGLTAIAGIVFLILFVPLQMYMGKLTTRFRSRTAAKTDQRVKLMNEVISGIQVIKMYTWEKLFKELIEKARSVEIRQITFLAYLRGMNSSFMIFMNRTGIFLCILTYALTEKKIDAQYVFVVSSFYAILRQTLTVYFPFGINSFCETRVSISRIRTFLLSPEVPSKTGKKEVSTFLPTETKDKLVKQDVQIYNSDENVEEAIGIRLQNVSVKWLQSSLDRTLHDISFKASSNELVAIIGPVGSGKSTLLYTILQELPLDQGKLRVNGRVSFAAQEPWLFSGTIRQNILFGSSFHKDKYEKIINICGLAEDFSQLPYGDSSQVGERGVMLSGGQKARINLARAIYKEADIYLLDDPFAAVDTRVGKKIFQECISSYLKDKCTVLVTHHLKYLGTAQRVYKMTEGSISLQEVNQEVEGPDEEDLEKQSSHTVSVTKQEGKSRETNEERQSGSISRRIYKRYTKAGGNYFLVFVLIIMFVLTQLGASGADFFLAFWVDLEGSNEERSFFTHEVCTYTYISIIIFIIAISTTRSIGFFKFCTNASENLHNSMFLNVITSPMKFFNTNPSGRILNRFSKDVGLVDEILPVIMMDTFQIAFVVLGSTLLITMLYPWMIFPSIVILTLFYFFRKIFLATSRNLKRLEATNRSPMYSHLNATLNGLSTIRSYNAQNILKNEFDHYQDRHSSSFYMFVTCNRAFGFWLDMNCVFYIFIVVASIMLIDTSVGNVGLAITQSMNLIGVFQWGIRQWSELENQMINVERIVEYADMVPEKSLDDSIPFLKNWPSEGHITFESVSMKYSQNEPPVLHQVSFEVHPKEKIGIVGRTGAGKSSLVSALFRLFDSKGQIIIDGVDVANISLSNLRSKISIIPQEAILFTGTLRDNLDPFKEFEDEKIWRALEQVELKSTVSNLPNGLFSEIRECGSNFSVGQRQLICLARAILRNNKILVLDEATANVDIHTDQLIQKTIKNNFCECTVLTIAHRLHTIMDSDKVLVLEAGRVMEFDHPFILLQNSENCFAQLVKESGKEMADYLTNIAKQDYEEKNLSI